MKIIKVKPFIMWNGDAGRNWLFVKVETDEGIHGWGEGSLVNQTPTIAQAVNMLAENIIGHDASAIERHWQTMFLHNRYRGGVIINSALSAIDQALWDIKGKSLDVPVYQLLGGAVRDKIIVYTGIGDRESALQCVKKYGFKGIKTGSWYSDKDIDERKLIKWLYDHISMLREAVGPDVDIMVDNHGRSRPGLAIKQIKAIEDLGLLFFEEPVPPDNVDSLSLIRRAGLKTDIATGERILNRWGYKDIIERQLVDIIQPDICHCGGISEMKRIAAMAEIYYILLAPHNPKGPIATAANLHVCATIPNFLNLEHTYPNALFDGVQVEPIKMDGGFYNLPTSPGLGVDLNEDVILDNPFKDRPVIQAFHSDGTPCQS